MFENVPSLLTCSGAEIRRVGVVAGDGASDIDRGVPLQPRVLMGRRGWGGRVGGMRRRRRADRWGRAWGGGGGARGWKNNRVCFFKFVTWTFLIIFECPTCWFTFRTGGVSFRRLQVGSLLLQNTFWGTTRVCRLRQNPVLLKHLEEEEEEDEGEDEEEEEATIVSSFAVYLQ